MSKRLGKIFHRIGNIARKVSGNGWLTALPLLYKVGGWVLK